MEVHVWAFSESAAFFRCSLEKRCSPWCVVCHNSQQKEPGVLFDLGCEAQFTFICLHPIPSRISRISRISTLTLCQLYCHFWGMLWLCVCIDGGVGRALAKLVSANSLFGARMLKYHSLSLSLSISLQGKKLPLSCHLTFLLSCLPRTPLYLLLSRRLGLSSYFCPLLFST